MANPANVSALLAQHPAWVSASGSIDPIPVTGYTGSDESAAAAIWEFAMGMPYADPVDKVWWSFGGGSHFVALNTAQALGLQPADVVPEGRPPVYLAEQAIEYAKQGWYYHGQAAFSDLSTPEGAAQQARREKFAEIVPPQWNGVDPKLYWLLVLDGTVPSMTPDLGWRPGNEAKNWAGFTVQKWLDNQWAIREGKPKPWGKGGVPA